MNFKILVVIALAFLFSSCGVKTPATIKPVPNEFQVSKDFFKGRTFLCGWAAEQTSGTINGAILDHYNYASHCNIQFDINEDQLVGKLLQPSKLNDRNQWPTVITIPIKKHYRYEKEKDQFGREKNVYIENTGQDHWSRRPYMDLDLIYVVKV